MKSESLYEEITSFVRFVSLKDIKTVVLAGVIAETVFGLYTWFVSPILFDQLLQPSNLVIAIARMTLGIDLPHSAAFAIHALIGSIGFASCVYVIKKVSKPTYLVAGVVTGILLWFVAQGILAPFVGRPFMREDINIINTSNSLFDCSPRKILDQAHPTQLYDQYPLTIQSLTRVGRNFSITRGRGTLAHQV